MLDATRTTTDNESLTCTPQTTTTFSLPELLLTSTELQLLDQVYTTESEPGLPSLTNLLWRPYCREDADRRRPQRKRKTPARPHPWKREGEGGTSKKTEERVSLGCEDPLPDVPEVRLEPGRSPWEVESFAPADVGVYSRTGEAQGGNPMELRYYFTNFDF